MEKLRKVSNQDMIHFACPGCESIHGFTSSWEFNNNFENPTVSPSIRVSDSDGTLCHLYIQNGKIIYLDDCKHELKGKTVDMVDIDEFLEFALIN